MRPLAVDFPSLRKRPQRTRVTMHLSHILYSFSYTIHPIADVRVFLDQLIQNSNHKRREGNNKDYRMKTCYDYCNN